MGLLSFLVMAAVFVAVWVGLVVGGMVGFSALCATVGQVNQDLLAYLVRLRAALAAKPGHHDPNDMTANYAVWIGLLVMTLIEVGLAYIRLPMGIMLVVLLSLSTLKAFLIMAWFMHLKFERASFVLTLVPALIAIICLLFIVYPDGMRNQTWRDKYFPGAESGDEEAAVE